LAQAQSSSRPADEPVGLEIAYAMSFLEYDACGDVEAGRIFRELILEKVKSCPYSPAAKDAFHSNVAMNMEQILRKVFEDKDKGLLDEWVPMAVQSEKDDPHGGPKSCEEYREMPSYLEDRERFMRYKRREIGVDEALGESGCPSGPASL
jgi:hypothetical protein